MQQGTGLEGCAVTIGFLMIVLIVLGGGGFILDRLDNIFDSQADARMAHAEEVRAQEQLETARSTNYQREFQLWTVAMRTASSDGLLVFLALLAGAGVGLPVAWLIMTRRWRR